MTTPIVLPDAVSPETAVVVDDYPYGRLRCKMRYWVETKTAYGQHLVSQPSTPKKPGLVWNKPKAGIYHPLIVMYCEEGSGHVKYVAFSVYCDNFEEIEAWGALDLSEHQAKIQQGILALRRQRGADGVTEGPGAVAHQQHEEP